MLALRSIPRRVLQLTAEEREFAREIEPPPPAKPSATASTEAAIENSPAHST
jgi:hypothetical protein